MNHAPLPHDPRFDALLDEALAPEQPDPALADRILAATRPRLAEARRGPTVLARLAPLVGVAASLAVALGLASWAMRPAAPVGGPPVVSSLALAEARLHALAASDTAWGTDVDRQLTVLSLQVDVATSDEFWTNPQRTVEDAVLHQQLDTLVDDPFYVLF